MLIIIYFTNTSVKGIRIPFQCSSHCKYKGSTTLLSQYFQSIGQIRNTPSSHKERGRDGWLLLGNVRVGDKAIESKRLREQVRMRDQKHWSRGGHELILKGKKLEIDKLEIFLMIVLLRGSHSSTGKK